MSLKKNCHKYYIRKRLYIVYRITMHVLHKINHSNSFDKKLIKPSLLFTIAMTNIFKKIVFKHHKYFFLCIFKEEIKFTANSFYSCNFCYKYFFTFFEIIIKIILIDFKIKIFQISESLIPIKKIVWEKIMGYPTGLWNMSKYRMSDKIEIPLYVRLLLF